MCIAVFMWKAHPLYPFLLLLNRDEYHKRPTKPLAWWEGEQILGGRDELGGGTWLGCSRDGKVAFLTNVRELHSNPQAKTRGHLPVRFLEEALSIQSSRARVGSSQFSLFNSSALPVSMGSFSSMEIGECKLLYSSGLKNPWEFAEEIKKEADQYNGFNLILVDVRSETMVYVTNRPKEENILITEVLPGNHVLSNARLDTPWPKAERLRHGFQELLEIYGEGEVPVEVMIERLMRNTIKDDKSMLPNIYPLEQEYFLSSIFIDVDFPLGRYGTRSTSALYAKACGAVSFHEGYLENELWNEQSVTYQIV